MKLKSYDEHLTRSFIKNKLKSEQNLRIEFTK